MFERVVPYYVQLIYFIMHDFWFLLILFDQIAFLLEIKNQLNFKKIKF